MARAGSTLGITVLGLWHLGLVSAGCLSRHFRVTAVDADPNLISQLQRGITPISEPGLDQLLTQQASKGRLHFQSLSRPLPPNRWLWLGIDTPITAQGYPLVNRVTKLLDSVIPRLKQRTTIIINSQLPVGTTKELESKYPQHDMCYLPENLRLGSAIHDFFESDRLIIGCRKKSVALRVRDLLSVLRRPMLLMSPESAELSKHALNSFLATSVVFANEIASICASSRANAADVLAALKSDMRIGPRAYLHPGPGYAGGTLERDVLSLSKLGRSHKLPLLGSISRSNKHQLQWAPRKVIRSFPHANKTKVLMLGLTYKSNTSTLRGSNAVKIARQLLRLGYQVDSYDPSADADEARRYGITLLDQLPRSLQTYDVCIAEPIRPDLRTSAIKKLLKGSQCHFFDTGGNFLSTMKTSLRYSCPLLSNH